MKKQKQCSVAGCKKPVHSKGFCRTHYGRHWRGVPLDHKPIVFRGKVSFDAVKAAERDLEEAKHLYSLAANYNARMYWHNRIRDLENTIKEGRDAESSCSASAGAAGV